MSKITLCGRGKCCPEANFTPTGLIITDDYGGRVTLTIEEATMLAKAIKANRAKEEKHE